MSAHTPGPWWLDNNPYAHIRSESGCVWADDFKPSANARLICAAPDLLALAHAVAKHFDGTDAPLGIQARAAINAAEGREA